MSEASERVSALSPQKRQLFELLLKKQSRASNQEAIQRSDSEVKPLSFSQQGLWLHDQLEPGNPAYNIPGAFRVEGQLSRTALEAAINEIVQRHESLRTSIQVHDGVVTQVVEAAAAVPIAFEDLRELQGEEQEIRLQSSLRLAARHSFDLTRGPLLRVSLIRLQENVHILALTTHHIISDGWSIGIFISELAALYKAFLAGEPSPLRELSVQYSDYASFQRHSLEGEALDPHLEFWKQKLAGVSPVDLSTDRARPAEQSFAGARIGFQLSPALTDALKQLSLRNKTTLYMTLLAAIQTLLYRYSQQEDIVIGTDVANRNHVGVEDLIGLFVNQLVVRLRLKGELKFIELLQLVREATIEAYAHQEMPFELIVEHLQPVRDLNRSPFFQIKFVYQNTPAVRFELPGLIITREPIEWTTAKFDLVFTMMEGGEGLSGLLEYSSDLFERGRIERLLAHFEVLLQGIAAQPEQRLWELPLLGEAEWQETVRDWNQTSRDDGPVKLVQELFAAQAARQPEAIALVSGAEQLSYGELNARANRLAHYLRKQGVGAEVVVGLCLERSVEMVVALLGIMKAGGAYLPLDPEYPQPRLEYLLADAQVGLVLTEQQLLPRLPVHWGRTLVLEEVREAIAQESAANPEPVSEVENLAYVIYTSGSTGQPKGVMVTHGGLGNYLQWASTAYPFAAGAGSPLHSTLSFDLTVTTLYAPLVVGGWIDLLSEGSGLEEAWRERSGYGVVKLTPAHLRLLNAGEMSAERLRKWSAGVVVGGEALSSEQVRAWVAAGVRVYNEYGPTETVVGSSVYELTEAERVGAVSIGRPIANTELYVLDQWQQPVAIGVRGELYIGGAGVARGYRERAELTAERFVPHPYSVSGGERLYRTGDEGRYLEDGRIEYLGRRDQQVKVRGYRIELGEIEAVLESHGGVRQAVVTVREEGEGDQRLVGYVVTAEGLENEREVTAALRSYLKERLPEYMVPQQWVLLEQLPLTVNGKVDREALPAPSSVRRLDQEEEGEWTPVEELVAGIWSEVLKVATVGREENFFELGGHSLLATQMISRVREVFGVEVELRRLFAEPTVSGLSRSVEEQLRAGEGLTVPPLVKAEREQWNGLLPLSFAQQRLWFLDQLAPGDTSYIIPIAMRLSGALEIAALEQTLSEVVRRHEVLRTRFVVVGGEPRQEVCEAVAVQLPLTDLSELDEAARVAAVREAALGEGRQPFDLAQGPVLRVKLLRLSAQEHVVLLTLHHIVSDGWSRGLLIKEVATLYEAYSKGEASPLPELKVQYADFAVWQRGWLQGEALERQLGYWREQLSGELAVLEMPTDHPRPAVAGNRGAQQRFELGSETTARLRELSRREGVTLFMTLLAAFQTLLYRYSGQADVVVGSPVAGRNYRATESLLGFFVNTLPLRVQLSGELEFVELLRRVKEVCLGAYAHQDVPFEKLVEELQPRREASRSPIYQAVLTLQNAPRAELQLSGLRLQGVASGEGTGKYELNFSLSESGRGLEGFLEYHAELYEAETIRKLLGDYQRLLERVVSDPAAQVGRLRFLSAAEEQEVLVERNQTQRAYHSEGGLRQWLTAVAAKYREQAAVVCGSEQLSYGELDQRSNQLAHYLRRQGVRSGAVVGLCLEQSVELVVGLLGIVKAGGTYLPLDPGYPRQRMEYVLREAQVQLVLTQQRLRWPAEWQWLALDQLADEEWETIAQESEAALSFESEPDALVYVMYTSGTTGQPKGVAIGEAALLNYLQWALEQYVRGERLSFGVCTSIGFDLTVTSIYLPLLSGGRLVLYQPGAEAVAAVLRENQVEVLKLTPSHLLQLAGGEHGGSRLRRLIVGGEALSVRLAEQVMASFGGELELYNEYGPTEATVGCMVHRYEAGGESGPGVSIGRAAANTEIYVLDEGLEPLGENVVGEIYIGGAGLARGYWQAVAQTAAKFVPHPYSRVGGARLYRSGDLGRWRRDGRLEYLGRRDEQVKYQGHRVELQELRGALNEHPEVRESVVRLERDGEAGSGVLVAYYVSRHELAASELRSWLSERVIKETVPSVYVHLKRLPLGLNGKVNYEALPGLNEWRRQREQGAQASGAAAGEWTPVEELVAGIWSELLKITRMGREENFFELGGHSLLATQVISRVREVFGVEVGLRRLFEEPTVRGLGRSIEAQLRAGAGLTVPPLVRAEREQWGDLLPLSFAQQRLWFLDQLEPGSGFYNVPVAVRLKGKLVVAALEQTLTEIVRRHEVLRTRFVSVAGEPRQEVLGAEAIQLQIPDLSELAEAAREAAVKEAAAGEARDPFALAHGPLLRVKLLRLSEQEHVVLLTMHHIVSDEWSLEVLIKEVVALYTAYCKGHDSSLKELPIQYGDFAVWQRGWLQGEELERQMAYWREQLSGELPVLELPTDRPRPAVPSYCGAEVSFRLNPELSAGLKELSRREGVTLFMTMLAAFQILLHRYSGQNDIVTGTVITNRRHAELEPLIGLFVNSLALRLKFDPELGFVELLQRVKEVCLGGYAHQDVPFEKLVEELQPKRDLSRSPVFQTMFIFHNLGPQTLEMMDLQLSRLQAETKTAKLDLIMSANETAEGLDLNVEFSTDLFETARIERLLRHFETLVRGIVSNPVQRLWELPLLPEDEWQQTVRGWNETRAEYAKANSVTELFAVQVERNPDSVAIVCGTEQLTYSELDQRANQLARKLKKLGVGPEVVVGVCLERSLELLVSMLGILKAGGAYLPLEPSYPKERLAFLLQDSGSNILLTDSRHKVPGQDIASVVLLDEGKDAIAAESVEGLTLETRADALAYVIYTSGSTGQPKGVMINHGSVLNLFAGINGRLGVKSGEVWTNCHSAAFDFSVWEIWGPLLSGGRLVIVPVETLQAPAELRDLVKTQAVTVLSLTPSAVTQVIDDADELWSGNLKNLVVGGEACPAELAARLSDCGGPSWNFYGPTEATVWTSIEEFKPGATVTVGRPISNTELYVLDQWQQPVAVGVRGEIYIGGAGLARGYWQRAELTAERFVPHPYSVSGGERLYRTGDEGRYLEDGRIEYLGRRDQQVKLRGYRIELGEIETVLEGHPGVQQAVVTVREVGESDQRLVGYIVAEELRNERELAAELRTYLKERLPEYMVPQHWVLLERLPLTANGKVDRRALPALSEKGLLDHEEGEWRPVEELVAGIWSEVLKVKVAGREENFFDLGGHSLLATQVISRVREVLGVEVELRRLFAEPTVRGLSRKIEEQLRAGEGVTAPPLVRAEREQWDGLLPVSFAQQRLWFLNQFEPERTSHNVPAIVRLKGKLNVAALERVVSEIVRRHEVLRTRFVIVDGEPRQQVLDTAEVKLAATDFSALTEAEREVAVKQAATAESREPFDLAHGPLLRARLLRLSDDEHVVLATMHHIVSDGWSMGVLVNEVATLYEAYSQNMESPLPELMVQYSDFAVWQRSWLHGEELDRQLEFWRDELAGADFALNLPFQNSQLSTRTFRCARQHRAFAKDITDELKALSQKEGVTLFIMLAAVFQTLLHRYSGQEELLIGTPIAGRNQLETERMIGFFVNLLPLRFDLSGNPTFRELLARARKVTLRALTHQDLPFDRLVVELQPDRAVTNPSLFHFVLTLQNAPRHDLVLPELEVSFEESTVAESQFDLEAKLSERAGELHCSLEYNTDVFDEATIAQMLVHLQALLVSCVETPDVPIRSLNLTSDAEAALFKARTSIPELQDSFVFG